MNYAIIAAGEGSRLANEGIKPPKPLVRLHGITLLDRLIGIFLKNNAESISLIINEEMKEVQDYVKTIHPGVPFNVVVRSTPSSMHSFYALSPFLQNGKFCLTTVDTLFKEDDFKIFIQTFETDNECDGMMAVTSFVDDEKPLYVDTDKDLYITGFADTSDGSIEYVSGGIYGLTPKAIPSLKHCIESGIHRMRNYQRHLVSDNLLLKAFPFSNKIIDVDHAEDIRKAECFLNQ